MYLTVGEISKVLGISTEMIRFYIREGIITPKKNEENNYWEYSSTDVMYLSDIMFYRDLDLSLKDIKAIFDGMPVERIGEIIAQRKLDAIESIEKYQHILSRLQEWDDGYQEELELIGKCKIGPMPSELRKEGYLSEDDHIAAHLRQGIKINKADWIYVSLSFYCNINDPEIKMRRYISVNKTRETARCNEDNDVIEETAEHCIYTQVHFNEDVQIMLEPLLKFAEQGKYQLTGEFYGRENTNYYIDGKRLGLYRIYAPIKQ